MAEDTIIHINPYNAASQLCYPVVWKVTANGVHVIVSPNGSMNNIVGEENVDKFIDNYKEKHLEQNLKDKAERIEKRRLEEMRGLEARANNAN